MRVLPVLMFFCGLPALAMAEMYKWVDDQGRVHFSDKKPAHAQAQDISESVKQQNIDYGSTKVEQQLQRIERNQAAKQTEQQQRTAHQSNQDQERERSCKEARKHLRVIKGRVIFLDDENREVKVTEAERAQKAAELEQQIQKYCQTN